MSETEILTPPGSPVRAESTHGGALWRLTLATPKANILDRKKIEILSGLAGRAARERSLKAILIDAEGPHFSFGASVEEHLPESCGAMLRGFHGLFLRLLDASVVTLAAVRGRCLGGGLELAAFCNRLFAAPDAQLGQPEILLGVVAPVASAALAERVGRGGAEDLCLSGRTIDAVEAHRLGLVDEIADDPAAAALAYAREHLLPRSASSLRYAVRSARAGFGRRFREDLAEVERLYLEELMSTADASEGLAAFLDKRPPAWSDA